MSSIDDLLLREQNRLQSNLSNARRKLNASFLKEIEHVLDEMKPSSYTGNIDMNSLSLNKRLLFDENSKIIMQCEAKLSIFNNFVKSNCLQSTFSQSYNGLLLDCDYLNVSEAGTISGSGIYVVGYRIKSPMKMPYQQYANLYTSSLNALLSKLLGSVIPENEKRKLIRSACLKVTNREIQTKSMSR